MINQEKVALMTKLATYEDGEGKKSIPQSKYYREDYISLKMINTGIIVTLAYILVLAIIVFVNVEKMMTQIANMDFVIMCMALTEARMFPTIPRIIPEAVLHCMFLTGLILLLLTRTSP